MKLKIMTFNTQHCLNYITRKIDFDIMAKAINDCAPALVSLNEMRSAGTHPEYTDQVGILAELTDMQGYFAEAIRFDGSDPYGNGLLSRYPILDTKVFPIPAPVVRPYTKWYEDRCLLKATVDIQGERLTVMVIHVGLNPDEAKLAIDTILAHLPSERCILMGDFNLTPESPLLAPIFERMRDAAALIEGDTASYPSPDPTQKIDYIFATKDIRIESAEIPAIVASDHRPHTAVISF